MKGLMTTKELAEYLSVSPDFIQARRENDWLEGLHWSYLSPSNPKKGIRYVPELCLNWWLNRQHPAQHQAFLADFKKRHKLAA